MDGSEPFQALLKTFFVTVSHMGIYPEGGFLMITWTGRVEASGQGSSEER
jgi:hypothetical protein